MTEVNKIRYGLSNLTVFFRKSDTEDGEPQWDAPVRIPGVTQCSTSPQTSTNDFYADNVLYHRANAYTGDEVTLTTAFFPDDVKAKMLGWETDENGAVVATTDGAPAEFAMAFQVEGDQKARVKVYYSCVASVPGDTAETKGENVTVQTEEMTIRSKAISVGGRDTVSTVLNESEDAAAFEAFFDSVYVPSYPASGSGSGSGD